MSYLPVLDNAVPSAAACWARTIAWLAEAEES